MPLHKFTQQAFSNDCHEQSNASPPSRPRQASRHQDTDIESSHSDEDQVEEVPAVLRRRQAKKTRNIKPSKSMSRSNSPIASNRESSPVAVTTTTMSPSSAEPATTTGESFDGLFDQLFETSTEAIAALQQLAAQDGSFFTIRRSHTSASSRHRRYVELTCPLAGIPHLAPKPTTSVSSSSSSSPSALSSSAISATADTTTNRNSRASSRRDKSDRSSNSTQHKSKNAPGAELAHQDSDDTDRQMRIHIDANIHDVLARHGVQYSSSIAARFSAAGQAQHILSKYNKSQAHLQKDSNSSSKRTQDSSNDDDNDDFQSERDDDNDDEEDEEEHSDFEEQSSSTARTPSLRCNCPCRIYLLWVSEQDRWQFQHKSFVSTHSHSRSVLQLYIDRYRLDMRAQEATNDAKTLFISGAYPREVLNVLKQKYDPSLSVLSLPKLYVIKRQLSRAGLIQHGHARHSKAQKKTKEAQAAFAAESRNEIIELLSDSHGVIDSTVAKRIMSILHLLDDDNKTEDDHSGKMMIPNRRNHEDHPSHTLDNNDDDDDDDDDDDTDNGMIKQKHNLNRVTSTQTQPSTTTTQPQPQQPPSLLLPRRKLPPPAFPFESQLSPIKSRTRQKQGNRAAPPQQPHPNHHQPLPISAQQSHIDCYSSDQQLCQLDNPPNGLLQPLMMFHHPVSGNLETHPSHVAPPRSFVPLPATISESTMIPTSYSQPEHHFNPVGAQFQQQQPQYQQQQQQQQQQHDHLQFQMPPITFSALPPQSSRNRIQSTAGLSSFDHTLQVFKAPGGAQPQPPPRQ